MGGFNAATFLYNLRNLITGDGFKRTIPGIGIASIQIDAGLIVDGSTNPRRTAVTNFDVLAITNNQTDVGRLYFVVPRDYDELKDELKIRLLAVSEDVDVPKIDGKVYRQRAGAALSSDLDPTISAAINTAANLYGWVEVDASGLGLKPGDALTIELSTDDHTTDEVYISGLEVVYRSTLVYFEKLER